MRRARTRVLAAVVTLAAGVARFTSAHADEDVVLYTVTGLRNDEGMLRCGLYSDEEVWLDEDGNVQSAAAEIIEGQATCVFLDPPPGTYSIAALHDEDADGEMDTTLIGTPEEGHSATRNAQADALIPDWDDARFVYEGGILRLEARVEY